LERQRSARPAAYFAFAIACAAFAPYAFEFLRRGVPDVLFTGDGATLELRTLHALHGVQLLGPYSRFGWSHPGPLYFYLAAPIYAAFGQHGPALNVFALAVNACATVAAVASVRRLLGPATAMVAAAAAAVYVLAAAPFVAANEWNPILPILPFSLFLLLSVETFEGDAHLIPVLVFLGSAIVQTHVAFAPSIAAAAALVILMRRRASAPRASRATVIASLMVAFVCWILPVVEAISAHPGNLQLIARFFVPKNWAEHSWPTACATALRQMGVELVGFARILRLPVRDTPGVLIVLGLTNAAGLAAIVLSAPRSSRTWQLGMSVLLQLVVAVFAVRAIRGDIEPYLVSWISVLGLLTLVTITAAAIHLGNVTAPAAATASAIVLLLALFAPVARSPAFRSVDRNAEQVAQQVAAYLTGARANRTIVVESTSTWPTAAATALLLTKRGIHVSVEDKWLTVFGSQFAPDATSHGRLIFSDGTSRVGAEPPAGTRVAGAPGVVVYDREE
jgi:hypothetical protein